MRADAPSAFERMGLVCMAICARADHKRLSMCQVQVVSVCVENKRELLSQRCRQAGFNQGWSFWAGVIRAGVMGSKGRREELKVERAAADAELIDIRRRLRNTRWLQRSGSASANGSFLET